MLRVRGKRIKKKMGMSKLMLRLNLKKKMTVTQMKTATKKEKMRVN